MNLADLSFDAEIDSDGRPWGLPLVGAIRGSIRYRYPVPVWLDSDPYRLRTYRYEEPPVLKVPSPDSLVASGGFCAPAGQWFDLARPLTGQAYWKAKEEQLRRERSLRFRFRRWWRAHWWPARIRDLEQQLDDRW